MGRRAAGSALSRLERALIAIVAWYGACAGQLRGQDSTHVVNTGITNHVLREWALLYREFRTEFLQCLYGRLSGDSLRIRLALNAHVRPSHSMVGGVTPEDDTCPFALGADSLIGVAHSHPQQQYALNGERLPLEPQANRCYESWEDIAMLVQNGLPVGVVVCGVGRIYVLRRGQTPNDGTNVCQYDPEAAVPMLVCEKRP